MGKIIDPRAEQHNYSMFQSFAAIVNDNNGLVLIAIAQDKAGNIIAPAAPDVPPQVLAAILRATANLLDEHSGTKPAPLQVVKN